MVKQDSFSHLSGVEKTMNHQVPFASSGPSFAPDFLVALVDRQRGKNTLTFAAPRAASSFLSPTTAQRRVTYFVRRGNKARRESLFRSLWTAKRKHAAGQKYRKYTGVSGSASL